MADPDIKPDPNPDAPIEEGRGSKWLWVGVIVVLAVAAVIVFLNPDGEEPELPDSAVTTQEERLNTDLTDESELTEEALEDVRGANPVATVTPDGDTPDGDGATADTNGTGEIATDPGTIQPAE